MTNLLCTYTDEVPNPMTLLFVYSFAGNHRSWIIRPSNRRQRQQLPSDSRGIVLYAGK